MNMNRKTIFLAAGLLLALAGQSCRKAGPSLSPEVILPETSDGRIDLVVSVSDGASTKASSALSDADVSSLAVYVFEADGKIDTHGSASSNSVALKCFPAAGKQVYAIVNKTVSGEVKTIADLKALTSDLSETSTKNFVMAGTKTGVNLTTGGSVTVDVYRIGAKVSIGAIKNNLQEPYYQTLPFVVKGIYLINVSTGAFPLFGDSFTPSSWANKCKWVSDSKYNALAYESANLSVAYGASTSGTHWLYCYPNPVTVDHEGSTWNSAGAKTRLVIETTIGGETYYYPITLDGVSRNCHYSISGLEITRRGSKDPNTPVTTEQVSFSVKVQPWTTVDMGQQVI